MRHVPSCTRRIAPAALLLAACASAMNASAGATAQPPGALLLTRTTFTVHNSLPTPLHGFRIRTGYQRWAEVGDLPPGDSTFTIDSPLGADPGTFEFLRDAPTADAQYMIGGYSRAGDGPVVIDISAKPGSIDGQPVSSPLGSFLMPPSTLSASAANPFAQDARLPLLGVPLAQAGDSEFMVCASITFGLSAIACKSVSLLYTSFGFGLNVGGMAGYFWSPFSPDNLAARFAVGSYTFQIVEAYMDFFSADDGVPTESIAKFIGLGHIIGAAINFGGFSRWGSLSAPDGTYRQTCADVRYDGSSFELSARCQDASGASVESVLSYPACFGGDVVNDGGTLRCERPGGSYLQSCSPVRYRGGVLQGRCMRIDGTTYRSSTLDYANACAAGSTVSNVDGELHCDQLWTPSGPYLRSCRNIRYAGGVLEADCGGLDTSARVRLDYVRQCKYRSDVDFNPVYAGRGYLSCVEAR